MATHNSMSVPLPGWYSSLQERPIGDQLDDGVRGLLIDTHYADRLPNGKVRTFFGSPAQLREQAKLDGVSENSLAAALRIRDRLGFAGEGERGMYLCHSFCELGATPLDSVLDDLHAFLVANPGAVVVVINQDYVTPEDFVGAVEDAGVAEFAYTGPTSGRWPTLREMVDSGKRVVFLAENKAGGAPWYHLAYDGITEETPFAFTKVAQLTNPAKLARELRREPGIRRLSHLPPEPLDHDRPAATALPVERGERVRAAAEASAGVPADPQAPPQSRGGGLLPPRGRVPGGGHPERRALGLPGLHAAAPTP